MLEKKRKIPCDHANIKVKTNKPLKDTDMNGWRDEYTDFLENKISKKSTNLSVDGVGSE